MIKAFLILLIILAGISSSAQNLQFYREDLVFEIKNNYFYEDGIYFLCNVGKNPIHEFLFYPLPVDKLYGKVDSLKFINLETSKEIKYYGNNGDGVNFEVKVNPYCIVKYKISYRQKLLGNKAEYILKTVQAWNKPLEIASFKLIVPDNLEITSLSFKPDTSYVNNKNQTFLWKFKDFFPTQNMIIKYTKH